MVKAVKLPELQFVNSAALIDQTSHEQEPIRERFAIDSGNSNDTNSSKVIISELRKTLNLSY